MIRMRHRGLRDSDAFLASYPRSGSTWLRFLLYEALTLVSAEFGSMKQAVPSVGKQDGARPVLPGGGRVVQTHERYLDRERRVVYVVRDPRSVVVSEYSWQRRLGIEGRPFEAFFDDFLRGRSNPWGGWDQHVRFWLGGPCARAGKLHLVHFEDMRADTEAVFSAALGFLGSPADASVVHRAVENNSLQRMREKEDAARARGWRSRARSDLRFVNTGSVGGWRNALSEDQARALEERFAAELGLAGYR
jgi:hypothetical protein